MKLYTDLGDYLTSSVNYMRITSSLITLVLLFNICGCNMASRSSHKHYSQHEIESNLKIGMSKEEVVRQFGKPTSQESSPDGTDETFFYISTPIPNSAPETRAIAGFVAYFQNARLKTWKLVHQDTSIGS